MATIRPTSSALALLAGGSSDFDLACARTGLEARLREHRWPALDLAAADVETRAVPGADDEVALALALGQWPVTRRFSPRM